MRQESISEIILHHYPMSTFSEKARLACGLKKLVYKQVMVPIASPKPDLVALTGGYRRAPVMQIGADIYCDSHLILRKLEALHPQPTLFPNGCEGEAEALAWWAERYIFMPALGFIAYINGDLYAPDFVEERRRFGYVLDKEELRPLFPRHVQQLVAHLAWLRTIMADGRPFMFGDEVSAADLAAYPSIWFLRKWGGAETERLLPITIACLGRTRRGVGVRRSRGDFRRGGAGCCPPGRARGNRSPKGRRSDRAQGRRERHGDA